MPRPSAASAPSASARTIIARLLRRKRTAEAAAARLPLSGSPIAAGERPHAGLVSGIALPFRKPGRNPSGGREYSAEIAGRTATLRFWTFNHHPLPLAELRAHARRCFAWLFMLLPCSDDMAGSKGVLCDFLMFPDKRECPAEPEAVIEPVHCNGGISYLDREVARFCVYREEELFKVFVHETFHAFAVHGRFPEGAVANKLAGLGPKHRLEYPEVYGETWARIILVLFARGGSGGGGGHARGGGVDDVLAGLEAEAAYGWRGCVCVLGRVAANQARPQPTPAFEYYCLTGVAMVQHVSFLDWCAQHNRRCAGGVGFELQDPGAWLGWLGGVARDGLALAGEAAASGDAGVGCGKSARMTWHDVV